MELLLSKTDENHYQRKIVKKRGFASQVSTNEIFSVLHKLEIFDSKNQLKTRSHDVWNKALEKLNYRIEKLNLYLKVKKNFDDILRMLEFAKGIDNSFNNVKNDTMELKDDSNNADYKCENPKKCKEHNFRIYLDEKEWISVKPETRFCRGKKPYIKLKLGWTNIINTKMGENIQNRLPCPFALGKNTSVYTTGDIFFKFDGTCRECKNTLTGKCDMQFAESATAEIKIYTYNTRHIPHTLKRSLTGARRTEAKLHLVNQPAAKYKLQQIREKKMVFNGFEPNDLHSTAVYRKTRFQGQNEFLDLKNIKDPLDSLECL